MQEAIFDIEKHWNEIETIYPEPSHTREKRIQEKHKRTIDFSEHRKRTKFYSQLQTEHFKDILTGTLLILVGVFFIGLGWLTNTPELYFVAAVYGLFILACILGGNPTNETDSL